MKGFLVFLFFFWTLNSNAQKHSFVSYSTSEGLAQSQVSAICQDKNGYLWIGTFGGLTKFNGKDFVTYSSESGLLNNSISCLSMIDGQLWVGHSGGVSLHDNARFKKWAISEDFKDAKVRAIVKFKGKIIVAFNGAGVFILENNRLKKTLIDSRTNEFIRDLFVYKGCLFLATKTGLYVTSDLLKSRKIPAFDNYNTQGIRLWGEKLIISTSDRGLFKFDYTTKSVEEVQVAYDSLELKKVFVDSKETCWITTDVGILKISKSGKQKFIDSENGLPMGVISSVFEDKNGGIWLGSLGKGLLRFPDEKFFYFDKASGLASDLIISVNQDRAGDLWFGTFDKGIVRLNKKGRFTSIELPNNRVWCSAMNVNGFNWFGTDEGLAQVSMSGDVKVFTDTNQVPGADITALFKISPDKMYIGGSKGLSLYKNNKISLIRSSRKLNIGTVRSITFFERVLYLGTDKGLFRYRDNVFQQIEKHIKSVFSLVKDQKGNLWIGTESGLYFYKNNRSFHLTVSQNQTSNIITFLNYKDEKIFIGTNNGLYVISDFKKLSSYAVDHFGADDGLVDIETNLNSCFFDSQNRFWFGTSLGLMLYEDWSVNGQTVKPKVNLKSILLNYESFDYLKYSDKLDENGLPTRMILPFFKNNITLEIDGVSLSNHLDLQYQFWLEGYDEQWSPKSKNTLISFTGLAAGDYNLRVRAIGENLTISDEISIAFEVKQPFYKSWWFVLLIICLAAYSSYSLFKLKLRRESEKSQNEMNEYKSKLVSLEQKSLNASMNRHFIFNSLNSIQYFINSQDRLSANRYLTNFAKLIRKNLDSTNEEGNLITLAEELEGLELYLSLEAMRFKDRFDYVIHCNEVDKDSIIIPAMLLQPFVENAIIHGILPIEDRKGLISITISKEDNVLTIQIDDNGIGIKNSIASKDSDNGDHRSQGMEITAKRIDLIKKISNKGFDIIGPFQINEVDSSINGTRVLLKIPFENLEE